jgi:extracellular elastinolytic metalloproteinase
MVFTNFNLVANTVHDIYYQYGFNEAAGNFQKDNFGKGGEGNDNVLILNQAPGSNNSKFYTPTDGQQAVMSMYKFAKSTPWRDGSMDNTVLIHELSHGLQQRLTGGPSQVGCLQVGEAKGMNEVII